MKKLAVLVVALSFFTSIYLYPLMPDSMASHWNFKGDADGYMPKAWALFLMPFVSSAVFLLFVFIPLADPLSKNIEKFIKYFEQFIAVIMLFCFISAVF